MNEDEAPVVVEEPAAPSTDNINSEEGGVTPEEVAQVLGKPAPAVEEPVVEEEPEQPEAPVEPEEPVAEPKVEEPKVETPAADDAPEAPSFALEVEDANGVKFVINPEDNIDEVLKDFEPKDNGQIFKIIEDRMQLKLDAKAYAEEQAAKSAEAEREQAIANIQAGWDKEAEKLQNEKRLPVTADGKTNERLEEVYKFMAETNQKRVEAGMPPIQTLEDALDKLELAEKKAAEVEAAKKAKEEARARGALVGGSSAPASNGGPTYSAGSGVRNASQAIKKMGLL